MTDVEFPDRKAHRRRQRSGLVNAALAIGATLAVMVGIRLLMALQAREASEPPAPPPPVAKHLVPPPRRIGPVTARVARVSRIGVLHEALRRDDAAAVQREMDALQNDFRAGIDASEPAASPVYEHARTEAWKVPGVRSLAWLDRRNLFAIVETVQQRSQVTIDALCAATASVADAGEVAVSLDVAAPDAVTPELLRRKCSDPAPDAVADGGKPAGKGKATAEGDRTDPEQEKSLRILRDTTPEM